MVTKICPTCGSDNDDDAGYCMSPECGALLPVEAAPTPQAQVSPDPVVPAAAVPRTPQRLLFPILGAGTAVVAVAIVVFVSGLVAGPESTPPVTRTVGAPVGPSPTIVATTDAPTPMPTAEPPAPPVETAGAPTGGSTRGTGGGSGGGAGSGVIPPAGGSGGGTGSGTVVPVPGVTTSAPTRSTPRQTTQAPPQTYPNARLSVTTGWTCEPYQQGMSWGVMHDFSVNATLLNAPSGSNPKLITGNETHTMSGSGTSFYTTIEVDEKPNNGGLGGVNYRVEVWAADGRTVTYSDFRGNICGGG